MDLEEFRSTYGISGERVLAEVTIEPHDNDHPSGYIVIHDGRGRTLILNPLGQSEHLCLDAHAFVDGKDARTGVFGMDNGRRWMFETTTPATSHGWPATALVALLVGKQVLQPGPTTPCDECEAEIPDWESSETNKHHLESCSLYQGAVVG